MIPVPHPVDDDAIRISGLSQRFGDFTAIHDLTLSVPPGAFLVLVGPSGCGKSTLLRMLAGLDAPTGGKIAFMGRTVSSGAGGVIVDPRARKAGLVFQSYALWPHMTVAGNIGWPLKVAGWDRAAREARIAEVLSLLAIAGLRDRYPAEISGGQQQRVAIARTLAPKPAILLFDEPLSNLDAKLRIEMRGELMRIHRATGATSVYVTHDQVEAMTMASHVAVMNRGRVEQFGPPLDLLRRPATTFVATFLGTPPGNLLPVRRAGDWLVHGEVRLAPAALSQGRDEVQLLYRAEQLTTTAEAGAPVLAAEFAEAAPMAGRMMVTATVGRLRLSAITADPPGIAPGDAIALTVLGAPDAVFATNGERID
ncbi:MAG: ABC transporter ATP-binding protein [Rhodobacteraceae bacterium]|nr:ABC transporter ATP-binding protein [Paracoccaceae bacterium]